MKPRSFRRDSSGFTLIEVVISAALMALILVSASLCLSSGISSQKLIESRADAVQSARVALSIISADLRCACPLAKDLQFLGMHRMLGDMEADNLDFATHHYTPRRVREGDFCQVSYFVAREAESGKFSLWRRRNPVNGLDPLSGGSREEIARGLRGLKFEYSDGFDWYDEWGDPQGGGRTQNSRRDQPNASGMPEAIRITLWLEPDARSSAQVSRERDTGEPPLVMQTVARLNLAAISQRSTPGASASKSVNEANSGPKQVPPNGGSQ